MMKRTTRPKQRVLAERVSWYESIITGNYYGYKQGLACQSPHAKECIVRATDRMAPGTCKTLLLPADAKKSVGAAEEEVRQGGY